MIVKFTCMDNKPTHFHSFWKTLRIAIAYFGTRLFPVRGGCTIYGSGMDISKA